MFNSDENRYINMVNESDNKIKLVFVAPHKNLPNKKMEVVFQYNDTNNYSMCKTTIIHSIKDCDKLLFALFEYERLWGWSDGDDLYECIDMNTNSKEIKR